MTLSQLKPGDTFTAVLEYGTAFRAGPILCRVIGTPRATVMLDPTQPVELVGKRGTKASADTGGECDPLKEQA